MKKLFFALLLVSGFLLQKADAQVRVGVNINIGAQPDWGPYGYDNAQYYYFPDIDIYYDVLNREFVYFDGYDWRFSPYLPSMYSDFDLYGAYKVVINEPRPYLRADYYRRQYYSYRGYHNQPVIRDYRNNGYADRRDERFEQRGERYEQRGYRFEDHNRDNRSFDQRNNNYDNNNRFGQRGFGNNNNDNYQQRNNDNNRNGMEQRGSENNRHDQMNGNDRGFGQRNDNNWGFRRH